MGLEHWETYYRGGQIASCPTAADGGYGLQVREAWIEFFSILPENARILDVGTGNGAVAQIAAETALARGRHWEIHAADLARIDPFRDVPDARNRLAGIAFHGGVATEELPFESQSFDAVSGHYALEYTRTEAALRQVHRVLKGGGDAQFIMHHANSSLVRRATESLQEADLVFGQAKLFRRVHRLVTIQRPVPADTQKATAELRAAIHEVKQGLLQASQVGAGELLGVALDAAHKLLIARKQMDPLSIGQEVDRAEAELRASVRRLHDLARHARTEQDMELIQEQAGSAGFSLIECMPQYQDPETLIGWQLLLHRT